MDLGLGTIGVIYNRPVQKKNARKTSPAVPRKLALLVAAALASGPAHSAVLSFSTYLGTSSDGDYARHMKIDSAGFVHVAQMNSKDGATALTVRRFDPANPNATPTSGSGLYNARFSPLPAGTCVAGLAVAPDNTAYVAITIADSAEEQSCEGAATGTKGDAYVFRLAPSGNTAIVVADYTLGGTGGEQATGIALDATGNVYLSGITRSSDFPATVGSYQGGTDAFVAKFSPSLSLDMAVLLGGTGDDTASGLSVDAAGSIYLGMGSSLAKLGPDGALQHSTSFDAGDIVSAVAVSSTGPVAAGTRYGAAPAPEAFLARVSPAGDVLDYQTLGATGSDVVRGLDVAGDSIYVSGETFSENFPNVATPLVGASGGSEAFVARFGPDGLEYSTRFGGTDDDFAASVGVAPNGDVYVLGTTYSTDFPTVNPTRSLPGGANDLFLARLANEFDMATPSAAIASDVGSQAIRITRTGSLAGTASVKWTAVNGTAIAGTHYGTSTLAPSGTVNFAAGQGSVLLHVGTTVSGPNTIRVNPLANFATPRTFSISLSNPTGGPLVGGVASTSVRISQGVSGLQLQSNAVSVLENAGTVQVRVDRAPGSALVPATVNYATANVTALAGAHYTTRTGTLTWAAGDAEPKFIPVPIIDNAAANASRSFRVNLSGPTGAPILGSAFATVTILDQDNTIALASASQIVSEGASVTLQVRRTGSPTLPASVSWTTENVTALAGSDFGASGDPAALTGTLNWDAGDLTVRNIVIPVLDDATPEIAKTFKVNLSGVSNATLGVASTTITLNDNERGFAFQSPEYTVAEGQPSVVLTVRRLGPATSMATVTWTASSGSATAGLDFAPSPTQRSGTLTWGIGDATSKTITIPIVDDAIVGEPAETFTVSLSTTTAGHVITEPGIATVTIDENDLEPETSIQFGQPKYLVVENAGTVTLEVTRTDLGLGYGRQSQVSYATQPGTALAASDYATKSGTLVWPPGDTAPKQITVNIVNDAIAEPPETFRVLLSGANAGTKLGATTQASVTILDDDEKFPPHGAIAAGFSVPVDATRGWHVAGDAGAYEGVFALKSDEIEDGETAAIEMEGMFDPGNASFRVRISSEPGFDELRFYLDGELKTTWSGTAVAGWQMSPSYPLNGHHVLRWEYVKDGSISVGQDAAFIDGLTTPAFRP
jgi:hypothetical protein